MRMVLLAQAPKLRAVGARPSASLGKKLEWVLPPRAYHPPSPANKKGNSNAVRLVREDSPAWNIYTPLHTQIKYVIGAAKGLKIWGVDDTPPQTSCLHNYRNPRWPGIQKELSGKFNSVV